MHRQAHSTGTCASARQLGNVPHACYWPYYTAQAALPALLGRAVPADEKAPARPHCGVLYADFSTASMWSCFFTAVAVNSCAALTVTACY